MSLVTLSEAQARAGDVITQDHVDEVEQDLETRIGPLIGSRTETFYLSQAREPRWNIDGLWLSRRTNAVILTNTSLDGTPATLTAETDYRLVNGLLIEQMRWGASWLDTMAATYEPNDEELVRSVIYDMLAYRQTPQGLQSIRIGSYSETFFPDGQRDSVVMDALLRRVLPNAGLGIYGSPFRYAHARRERTVITGGGS